MVMVFNKFPDRKIPIEKIILEFVEEYRSKTLTANFTRRPACLSSESGTAVTHYINMIRGKYESGISAAIRQELSTDSDLTSYFYLKRD